MKIDFWDVGQGNCSVLTLDDGSLIIIDVGRRGSPLVDWLNDRSPFPRIRAVVLTHNDADHAGALPAIVARGGQAIESLYALVDRNIDDLAFRRVVEAARKGQRDNSFELKRLERGTVIWEDPQNGLQLRVDYPTMLENLDASKPNDTSGIICLLVNGKTEVIWPGDVQMQTVGSVCPGTEPYAMTGPHHGGPSDFRTGECRDAINSVKPRYNYISVGTHNNYSHPRLRFIRHLEGSGCRVRCSELTYRCDRLRVLGGQHVLKTHGYLGLRAPRRKYVSCRGPWQIKLINGRFESDRWEKEHLQIVATLKRPQCLLGRGWKKGEEVFP